MNEFRSVCFSPGFMPRCDLLREPRLVAWRLRGLSSAGSLDRRGLMMMPSKKMSLILALALFAGVLGMGMGVLAQGTEPVEKKQRGEVTAVQAADAPLEADRANNGAGKLLTGTVA